MLEIFSMLDGLVTVKNHAIKNTENGAVLMLPLPGVKREDVLVHCASDHLKVKIADSADCPLLTKKTFLFSHKIADPKVTAKVMDGMLTVELVRGASFEFDVPVG